MQAALEQIYRLRRRAGRESPSPARTTTRSRSAPTARSPSPSSTSPTAASRRSSTLGDGRSRSSATSLPPVEGLQIEYGGDLFTEFELPESEIYGILAAVIILILAFGSVLAMGLPIGTALFGLGIAIGPRVAAAAT